MRKTFYFILATVVAAMNFSGCKKNTLTRIDLPDSTKVEKLNPQIGGELIEYMSIVPDAYFLDLSDSLPRITFKLAVAALLADNEAMTPRLETDSFYVCFLDSNYNRVSSYTMPLDSSQVKMIRSMLYNDNCLNQIFNLTVTGPAISEAEIEQLAAHSENFALNTSMQYQIDSATIDQLLNKLQNTIQEARNTKARAGGIVYGTYIFIYNGCIDEAVYYVHKLDEFSAIMSDSQKQRFNKLRNSVPRHK